MPAARIILLACSSMHIGLGVIDGYHRIQLTELRPAYFLLPLVMLAAGCCGYAAQSLRASSFVRGLTVLLNVLVILLNTCGLLGVVLLVSEGRVDLPFAVFIWVPVTIAVSVGNIAGIAILGQSRGGGSLY